MSRRFQELAFTPLVKEHQLEHGSRRQYERMEQTAPAGNTLGPTEQDFIQRRDSFYMASVSETGWPYVQHRGGPKGFVRIMNENFHAAIYAFSVACIVALACGTPKLATQATPERLIFRWKTGLEGGRNRVLWVLAALLLTICAALNIALR